MTTFATIEAKAWHCGQMARKLRRAHAHAAARIGTDVHTSLTEMFQASPWRRAWLIDGKLAALGGVAGPMMADSGFVWLALAESTRGFPLAIVREARRQLAEIMVVKRELATTVLAGDAAAHRLAIFLGFHVSHTGDGQPAYTRMQRRRLAQHIEHAPECRIAVGGGHAIALGYHHEAQL